MHPVPATINADALLVLNKAAVYRQRMEKEAFVVAVVGSSLPTELTVEMKDLSCPFTGFRGPGFCRQQC